MSKYKDDYKKELPQEEVKVAISKCPTCKSPVRVAVEHKMNKKEFYKEVVEFNLFVETIPLLEFRKLDFKFCNCKI